MRGRIPHVLRSNCFWYKGEPNEMVRQPEEATQEEAESSQGRMEKVHGEAPRHARREASEPTFNRGSHGTA